KRDMGKAGKEIIRISRLFSPRFFHSALAAFPRKGECFLVGAPSGRTKSAVAEYALFLRARGHGVACRDCHSDSARLPFRQERHGIYERGSERAGPPTRSVHPVYRICH